MSLSKQEQAECLRRYGHEEEARRVESGQAVIPPDALKTSWACLQLADAVRELADSYSRPRWRVTARQLGCLTTMTVQAATRAEAAFTAGTILTRGCELVSVEAAGA